MHEARALFESVRKINPRDYERDDAGANTRELVTMLEERLCEADALLAGVIARYEPVQGAGDAGAEQRFSPAMQLVADVAFIARLELAQQRRLLASLDHQRGTSEHISACASVRHKLLESVLALERAICALEGREADNGWFRSELARSLEVRRVYAVFLKELDPDMPPDERTIHRRMRQVGVALAKLTGRDIYEELRIRDRQMLGQQQHEVLSWLRLAGTGASETHARAGIRLWTDVVGLGRLLMQVNNRVELREHDVRVLSAVWEALFANPQGVPTLMPQSLLDQIAPLCGLDADLDLCIAAGTHCPPADWEEPLWRLLQGRRSCH